MGSIPSFFHKEVIEALRKVAFRNSSQCIGDLGPIEDMMVMVTLRSPLDSLHCKSFDRIRDS